MAELRRVVVADPIDPAAVTRLRAGPCEVVDVSAEPAQLAGALPTAWALIVRSRTKVDRTLLAAAPALALVARAGVGVDSVDMAAAGERGIRVVNAPAAATASVAELSMTFYLLLVRGLLPKIASTRSGRWERGTSGHELAGRTVGFVGYGRIAREIARRLGPFGRPRSPTTRSCAPPLTRPSSSRWRRSSVAVVVTQIVGLSASASLA